ncbi:MAG TPA: hypothetical protein VM598_08745, partial [Bdellovibrionota bacterium]|nr:hypothetical protein [Bdellovibrionota bacterium]
IDRANRHADFTMQPWRPAQVRYVHITQPTLFTRGRRARLNYGDDSAKLLKYLVAYDDVLIKQIEDKLKPGGARRPPALKYATAGQADFDSDRSLIILTRFPQVYQDGDTVTGDLIKVHRETDIIEVEKSNSFSEGTPES